jgi:uncharacterized protein (UPF0332 family)
MNEFDWREYLNLAKFLLDLRGSGISKEALYRCAVSRAYYSAFGWARNYAQRNLGFKPTGKGEDHKLVREILAKKGFIEIAEKLDDLRKWRNSCDYQDVINKDLNSMAFDSIKHAEYIIQFLNKN